MRDLIQFVQKFRPRMKASQDIIYKYLAERNLEIMATIFLALKYS